MVKEVTYQLLCQEFVFVFLSIKRFFGYSLLGDNLNIIIKSFHSLNQEKNKIPPQEKINNQFSYSDSK